MNQDEIRREILKTLYIEWFGGRDRVGLRYLANERQWERKELDKAVEQLKHEYFIEIVASDLHGRITAYGILEAESAGIAPAELSEKSEAMRARVLDRLGRAWDEHGPYHHVGVDDLLAASGSGVGHIRTCLRLLKELGHIKDVSARSYRITPAGYEQVQEWRRAASLAKDLMPEKSDETNISTSHAASSIEIFYSYSHKDEDLRDKLDAHLSVLRRNGVITGWHDRRISAGSEWERSIDGHLESAGIILLLVSADFLASDYCYEREMGRAMERHGQGTARVIPVILRNCDWSDAPFGKLQALPKDGKPITSWGNMDDAFTDVARGIRKAIAEMENDIYHKPGTPEPDRTFDQVKTPGGSQVSADRGGVAFGDSAQGNVAITGGVQGDFVKQSVVVENNQGEIKIGDEIHHHHYAQLLPPAPHRLPPPLPLSAGQAKSLTEEVNGVSLEMVLIPGGRFKMGSSEGNDCHVEWPEHEVTMDDFYIGKYPITQAQWEAVTGGNPSHFEGNKNLPVENVSWSEAKKFCAKLSRMTGREYRLPSEAEWEYACRAGTAGDHAGKLDEMAWYRENSGEKSHPVGEKQPNAYGVYDMHGNVWEWCEDVLHMNYQGCPSDGEAWWSGGDSGQRVKRGGCWADYETNCRSANRGWGGVHERGHYCGFRVASSV